MSSQIALFIIKLLLSGIVAFLAIMIMSKTRSASWMLLVAGFLFSFAALIIQIMQEAGIFSTISISVFNIPLIDLLCTIIPNLCFIISFILKLNKK